MKAVVRKINASLFAVGDDAGEVFARLPKGEFLISIKTGRSAANHRRFFSFVKTTFDWQERYDNMDVWRKVLLMKAGHFVTVIDKNGNTQLWPESMSFDVLNDENKFRTIFSNAVAAYIKDYGPGLSDAQVNQVNAY